MNEKKLYMKKKDLLTSNFIYHYFFASLSSHHPRICPLEIWLIFFLALSRKSAHKARRQLKFKEIESSAMNEKTTVRQSVFSPPTLQWFSEDFCEKTPLRNRNTALQFPAGGPFSTARRLFAHTLFVIEEEEDEEERKKPNLRTISIPSTPRRKKREPVSYLWNSAWKKIPFPETTNYVPLFFPKFCVPTFLYSPRTAFCVRSFERRGS